MTTTYPDFGSVSSGTMRTEDLLPAFLDAAKDYAQTPDEKRIVARLRTEWNALDMDDADDTDTADEILSEITDLLEGLAPPYGYFGSLEGDGADYGFWPSLDSVEDACRDGSALKVSDLADVPDDYVGDVFQVSDHGNLTFYAADHGTYTEVWGIV